MKKSQNLRNQPQENRAVDHLMKRCGLNPPPRPNSRGVIASATFIPGITDKESRK